jgi:DNA-binding NarL/FixJ family response regulator
MPRFHRRAKGPIRVLIVTADNMTGELLTSAFSRGRKDFAVATLTGTSHQITRELGLHKPHVTLICAELQDGPLTGFNVLQNLRNSPHRTAAIMLLHNCCPDLVVSAFREGARGVFYRSRPLKSLSKCIQRVHEGQLWACNEDLEHVFKALVHIKPLRFSNKNGQPILTPREEDVVRLVAEGLKNRDVAQRLNVAEHTIRNYLSHIFEKLEVSTRVELILYAFTQREQSN